MKISDILSRDGVKLSFEVFPPKTDSSFDSVKKAVGEIAGMYPSFMSVTYGAGGGTSENTVRLAGEIAERFQVPTLAHLTCVSSTKQHVAEMLGRFRRAGIENVLALRGDIPEGGAPHHDYHYACELIEEIKKFGGFCIGGACYPEGHVESECKKEDLRRLREKVDMGCDFLTSQMFFDNSIFYNFLYRVREQGVTVPIIAGIMPVTNVKQIGRIVSMSGTYLPPRFKAILDCYGGSPAAMKQAGIIYASEQIIDLVANGVKHIHVYTMNQPDIASKLHRNLSELLK